MRSSTFLPAILLTLSFGLVSSSVAFTNHSLYWAFEVGASFDYLFSDTENGISYGFYVVVDGLPSIPDNVTSFHTIVFTTDMDQYYAYFTNGSELSYVIWSAIPVGNWSVIKQLAEASYDYDWIDISTAWGWEKVDTFPEATKTTTVEFSKSDGVMNRYRIVTEWSTATYVMEIARDTATPTTSSNDNTPTTSSNDTLDPILYLGVGAAATVILLVLVIIKQR